MIVYCQSRVRFKGRVFSAKARKTATKVAAAKTKKGKKAVKVALHRVAQRVTVTWRER